MHLAQGRDWQVEGIELNPKTAAFAARRTGAVVHRVNAQALTVGGRRFDAVTLTDVLEHIPEPVALLASIARLVKPGGWVAVKVPCGPGQWRKEQVRSLLTPSYRASLGDNLVHVNHFSRRSLALGLGACRVWERHHSSGSTGAVAARRLQTAVRCVEPRAARRLRRREPSRRDSHSADSQSPGVRAAAAGILMTSRAGSVGGDDAVVACQACGGRQLATSETIRADSSRGGVEARRRSGRGHGRHGSADQ